MTVLHHIEKSFRNDCAPTHLEMSVFHQIEKQFRNDCVPPNYLTVWKWLCPTKLRKVLEMTVFHLIIKWYGKKKKEKHLYTMKIDT